VSVSRILPDSPADPYNPQASPPPSDVSLSSPPTSISSPDPTPTEFQRLYTPTAFREERILWRAVIQLNVVRSVRLILDAISSPSSHRSPHASPYSSPRSRSQSIPRPPPIPTHIPPLPASQYADRNGFADLSGQTGGDSDPESDTEVTRYDPSFTSTLVTSPFDAMKSRLEPLQHIEALLIAKLVPPNEEEPTHLVGPSGATYPPGQPHISIGTSSRNQEVFVRPGAGWRGALAKARVTYPSYFSVHDPYDNGRPTSAGNTGIETQDEPQQVLYSCRQDMIRLWNDDRVRDILHRKKVRLEESPGLYVSVLPCVVFSHSMTLVF